MKLTYLAQIGVLDNWAHTVQIMKMCEAFSQNGIDVTLVVAKRKSKFNTDPYNMYGISKSFKIVELPYIDINKGTTSKFLYWVRFVSFLVSSRFYLIFNKYDVLYTREMLAAPFFRNVYIELHSFPKNLRGVHRKIFHSVSGIVVLTSFIKSKLVDLGIFPDKIFVAHDAVRLEDFLDYISEDDARNKVGLNHDVKVIGYVGSLKTMGMEKGVATAILSLNFLPESFILYVVGGVSEDIDFYKKFAEDKGLMKRVVFAGIVSHRDINLHISACDYLVAPFPDMEHYRYYMSPLKIFEYMASKKPIIVTDLPTLKEVLEDNIDALFIPPSNEKALADSILRLENDSMLKDKIIKNAYNKVSTKYTWKSRAGEILNYINK